VADVFISYQSNDRPLAAKLAKQLEASGLSIWMDENLSGAREFHDQIARELRAAHVVLTIWSRTSSDSRWVYSEADEADKASKLVNVTIDGTTPPKPFDRLHCRNLAGWNGHAADERYIALLSDIRAVAGRTSGDAPARGSAEGAAARAWALIEDSMQNEPYRKFLEIYGGTNHAHYARARLEDMAAWEALPKGDLRETLAALDAFILAGPFEQLGRKAKQERDGMLSRVEQRERKEREEREQADRREQYNKQRVEREAAERVEREFGERKSALEQEQRRAWRELDVTRAWEHAQEDLKKKRAAAYKATNAYNSAAEMPSIKFGESAGGIRQGCGVIIFVVYGVVPLLITLNSLRAGSGQLEYGGIAVLGLLVGWLLIGSKIQIRPNLGALRAAQRAAEKAESKAVEVEAHTAAPANEAWARFQRRIDEFEASRRSHGA
jgi:hypothetical protein